MVPAIRLAALALVAASIGGCSQTFNPADGPALTRLPAAGLVDDDGCVARNLTVRDPATGEGVPVRQRFCGGPPAAAAQRVAASAR